MNQQFERIRSLAGVTASLTIAVAVCCWPQHGCAATTYSIVNVADTTTAGPTGNFTAFQPPAISGDRVAFIGAYGPPGVKFGAFSGNSGGLTTIAKPGDVPVGLDASMTSLGEVSISNGNVAFWAHSIGPQGERDDFLVGAGGPVTAVVSWGSPAPGGTFTRLGYNFGHAPSIDGESVAVRAVTTGEIMGLYRVSGSVATAVVERGNAAPVGVFNDQFSEPALSGAKIAFRGEYAQGGSQSGIFTGDGGTLTTIAKEGDAAPSGAFTDFGVPALDGDVAAFVGTYGNASGIFFGNGGPLTTVVKKGDPAPLGTFLSFSAVAIDGGSVAFTGTYEGGRTAAFAARGGVIEPVMKPGDALFGGVVRRASVGRFGLDPGGSGRLAILYALEDGRSGVAMATPVPEPAGGVLGISLVAAAAFRRREGLAVERVRRASLIPQLASSCARMATARQSCGAPASEARASVISFF